MSKPRPVPRANPVPKVLREQRAKKEEEEEEDKLSKNAQAEWNTLSRTVLGYFSGPALPKWALWAVLFALAVYVEFGSVFVICSALYAMWKNTTASPGSPSGSQQPPSAYSVFNRNCERIDGTLDASSFDRELRRQMY